MNDDANDDSFPTSFTSVPPSPSYYASAIVELIEAWIEARHTLEFELRKTPASERAIDQAQSDIEAVKRGLAVELDRLVFDD
jgi:hypothetical protein